MHEVAGMRRIYGKCRCIRWGGVGFAGPQDVQDFGNTSVGIADA
ncbi:MAG TPA: hypothetical protein PK033_15215 [Acetivibrio sp.]|nr:hypothetical protein [Acetivibrio sp.]